MLKRNLKTTWFLVADGARASVMAMDGREGVPSPVFDHVFASPARAHGLETTTDRAGRAFDSYGISRHAMEPRTDWKTQVRQGFVRDMARLVESAALAGRFAHLILIAPPKALGMIRKALGQASRRCLKGTVCKEVTHLSGPELAAELGRLNLP